jgi:hypothetical protein
MKGWILQYDRQGQAPIHFLERRLDKSPSPPKKHPHLKTLQLQKQEILTVVPIFTEST